MTKKEAYNKVNTLSVINEIYKDFEFKICKNCVYFINDYDLRINRCQLHSNIEKNHYHEVSENSFCSSFLEGNKT